MSVFLAGFLSFANGIATYSFLPVIQMLFPDQAGIGIGESNASVDGVDSSVPMVFSYQDSIKEEVDLFYGKVAGEGDKLSQLARLVSWILGLVIITALIGFLVDYLFVSVNAGGNQRMRRSCFNHLVALPYTYFIRERAGTILSRMTNDIAGAVNMVSGSLADIIVNTFVSFGLFLVLLFINSKLVFVIIPVGILVGVVAIGIGEWVKRNKRRILVVQAAVMSVVQEILSGIKVVKVFNKEAQESRRWDEYLHEWRSLEVLTSMSKVLPNRLREITAALISAAVVFAGGAMIIEKQLTVPELILFFIVLTRFQQPVSVLVGVWFKIKEGMASAERVYCFLHEPKESAGGDRTMRQILKGIKLRGVCLDFGEGDVLRNVDLNLPVGKTLALVGESGSGKSSLADLLLRLYRPTVGELTVDGVNIEEYGLESYRRLFGVVSQDVYLFHDTIFNNIAYGFDGNVSQQEVENAAKTANAHEFIESLPRGYNTLIGDRGVRLSGGQRQRIAIARSVIRNPQVMIFDEATSALDSKSEEQVKSAIKGLSKERTTIIIAHRLSTVSDADIIAVMHEGRIVEVGQHAELLKTCGHYWRLASMQGK